MLTGLLKIGGWKTRAMLDRYNVSGRERTRAALKKSGEYVAALNSRDIIFILLALWCKG
jgi:hypothetical protein